MHVHPAGQLRGQAGHIRVPGPCPGWSQGERAGHPDPLLFLEQMRITVCSLSASPDAFFINFM